MDVLGLENNPYHTISQIIDEQSYDFTAQYNKRDDSWWIEVGFTGENPVIRTKMVVGADMLAPYRYLDAVPNRYFLLADVVKLFGRNDREGFATRYIPVLLTEEEYNEFIV